MLVLMGHTMRDQMRKPIQTSTTKSVQAKMEIHCGKGRLTQLSMAVHL